MLERKYDFLKNKYRELLLPTVFMTLSGKLCLVIDIILVGIFVNSAQLSAINLANPFFYLASVLYNFFGVGGSLLALRAKALQDTYKSNFYFSVSVIGVVLISMVYAVITFLFANEVLIHILNTPQEIFSSALIYIQILTFSFPFMCYITVVSFFLPADGFPKLTSVSIVLSNVVNLIVSALLMSVFHMGVAGSAIGSVFGYISGSICISTYFFKENHNFNIINHYHVKIKEILVAIKDFILNSPESFGKLLYTIKITFYTALCSTYLGTIGLAAFLVYDNSETIVFMFLSAITKVASPIVTVFYKEKDYEAVKYIIHRSIKEMLLIATVFTVFFAVFPNDFAMIFSITDPEYVKAVTIALRITAVGLVGRSISQLLINYTQAIAENKISTVLTFSQEFLISIVAGVVLTHFFGGIGIWFAIVLSDTLPLLIYLVYVTRIQSKYKDSYEGLLLLGKNNIITVTYERQSNDIEYYIEEASDGILKKMLDRLNDKTPVISKVGQEIVDEIFNKSDVKNVDTTMRLFDDIVNITITFEGELFNPISEDNVEELKTIDANLEYSQVLGYNRVYINVNI